MAHQETAEVVPPDQAEIGQFEHQHFASGRGGSRGMEEEEGVEFPVGRDGAGAADPAVALLFLLPEKLFFSGKEADAVEVRTAWDEQLVFLMPECGTDERIDKELGFDFFPAGELDLLLDALKRRIVDAELRTAEVRSCGEEEETFFPRQPRRIGIVGQKRVPPGNRETLLAPMLLNDLHSCFALC